MSKAPSGFLLSAKLRTQGRAKGVDPLIAAEGGRANGGRGPSKCAFAIIRTLQEIEAAVLRLPDKDLLQLADKLLGSLPPPYVPADADEILTVAIRRDAELESGRATPLSETEFWNGVRRSQG